MRGTTTRVTIPVNDCLFELVKTHVKKDVADNQKLFIERALLNQLEREGDFEARDYLESEEGEESYES